MARGTVAAWLRASGRHADADLAEREIRGDPHEMVFTFIRIFAPGSPPAFRGAALTLDNIVTLLKSREDPPEGGRGVLDAILEGRLKGFPQISSAFGSPLEEAVELALASCPATAETLACALAALQEPEAFIWGASGPPKGLKAAAFVLEAGCPLLEKDWWIRNVPPGMPFPEALLEGPLDSPLTYAEGALEARKGVASGKFTAKRLLKELAKETLRNHPDTFWTIGGAIRRLIDRDRSGD
jgi:hypothetical protein